MVTEPCLFSFWIVQFCIQECERIHFLLQLPTFTNLASCSLALPFRWIFWFSLFIIFETSPLRDNYSMYETTPPYLLTWWIKKYSPSVFYIISFLWGQVLVCVCRPFFFFLVFFDYSFITQERSHDWLIFHWGSRNLSVFDLYILTFSLLTTFI